MRKKAAFKDNKISANKIIYRLYRNLKLVGTIYTCLTHKLGVA